MIRSNSTDKSVTTSTRETTYMGSWHVARMDVVRMIVTQIEGRLAHPEQWEPDLSFAQAKHNALASWVMVSLGLLAGPRPFELTRIRQNNFDTQGGWVALRGKPHAGRFAFRRIPLLPELHPPIEALFRGCPTKQQQQRLGVFNREGKFILLTTKILNEILIKASNLAGMNLAPDFYSLRHRFRSDMLSLDMPENMLTYLMGHESRGIESCNIYLERSLHNLVPAYCDCARQLAREYGIHLETARE